MDHMGDGVGWPSALLLVSFNTSLVLLYTGLMVVRCIWTAVRTSMGCGWAQKQGHLNLLSIGNQNAIYIITICFNNS